MWMGTARVPRHPAGLLAVSRWGPAGLARIARFRGDLRRPHPGRRREHSARPGAVRSSRGQPARSGTGFPSPTTSKVPGRDDMSPATQDVPRLAECTRPLRRPRTSGALTQIVPHTALRRPARLPFQPPRAGQRQKQAAPHLRCGADGVSAPVQARYSLPGEDCSRHPPRTPTSARGHRTSSVGGILLPDPPS